jgi:hypothetical protein
MASKFKLYKPKLRLRIIIVAYREIPLCNLKGIEKQRKALL